MVERILLDTSVYGNIVKEPSFVRHVEELVEKGVLVVYGNKVIRDELRDTPKHILHLNRNFRILLLSTYDSFIRKENHSITIGPIIETIAVQYHRAYKRFGGNLSLNELWHDFIIIASASFKELDLIISADVRSMLSKSAVEAYKQVNSENGLYFPRLLTYEEFKKRLNLLLAGG